MPYPSSASRNIGGLIILDLIDMGGAGAAVLYYEAARKVREADGRNLLAGTGQTTLQPHPADSRPQ
jgi:hypothetical protein